MESQDYARTSVDFSRYSRRVLLKNILDRPDQGSGLAGERVIVGGWVKSSMVKGRKHGGLSLPPSSLERQAPTAAAEGERVTCSEIIKARINPFWSSLLNIFIPGINAPPSTAVGAPAPVKKIPYVAYLLVNDGSCVSSLQVVVKSSVHSISELTPAGTSILVEGVLNQASKYREHVVELEVEKVFHVGKVDIAKYQFAKMSLPLEFLRSYSHLRPRKTLVASVARIRSDLTYATHSFFQMHCFLFVHMPVITSIGSMGFGKTFHVTTLLSEAEKIDERSAANDDPVIHLDVIKNAINEKKNMVLELQRKDSNKEAILAALWDLQKTNELALQMDALDKSKLGKSKFGRFKFSEDYFSRQAFLSVSARLHLGSYACALGSIYTFGPTFRAEYSDLSKHLAESWMVETEIAFAELEDAMNCAEDYVKFLCQHIIENCPDDLKHLEKEIERNVIERIKSVASSTFERLTYTKAVELLGEMKDKTFETKLEWGIGLAEEHERYLADEVFKRPVIIYNHPKDVKPFYIRVNDDGRTVAAMDIILPKVGAVIRGSQEEERIDVITTRIRECGLPQEIYDWYLDLRRYGSVNLAGFSLGFEQMVLFITGLDDIRDVIPFPRSHGKLAC